MILPSTAPSNPLKQSQIVLKAVFVENLVRVNDCISITPGFRYDRIVTESDGFFHAVVNDSLYYTNNSKRLERGIFLAGFLPLF